MKTENSPRFRLAVRLAVACLLAAGWAGLAAAGEELGAAAKTAKKPLIWIQIPNWTHDDANWGGPYDGPSTQRMCRKILKDEAARLGVELSSDASRVKEFDGALSVAAQSPKADMPFVDVVFQGHRGFYDQFHKGWDLKRKRYLLASTSDPEWLRTGLRLLKAAWQVRTARVCVVTDEAGAADTTHPQLGTTLHPVPRARLDDEIGKVKEPEATTVAVAYMHEGRMDGTVEGHSGYQAMKGEKWLPPVDPAQAAKAKQDTIAAAKFYLGCRNLLAAENCQALTLTDQAKYGAAPVIAFAALTDSGVPAAFDRDATLMLLMAGSLLDRAGFVHGPLAKKGETLFATYFTCPTRLQGFDYEPPASFAMGLGPEGKDFGIQVRWRKGETITRLQLKDSKVLMGIGKTGYTDITAKEGHRTALAIDLEDKPGRPDPEAANCVIVYGNCTNEMSCLARLMDLDFPPALGVLVPK